MAPKMRFCLNFSMIEGRVNSVYSVLLVSHISGV